MQGRKYMYEREVCCDWNRWSSLLKSDHTLHCNISLGPSLSLHPLSPFFLCPPSPSSRASLHLHLFLPSPSLPPQDWSNLEVSGLLPHTLPPEFSINNVEFKSNECFVRAPYKQFFMFFKTYKGLFPLCQFPNSSTPTLSILIWSMLRKWEYQ